MKTIKFLSVIIAFAAILASCEKPGTGTGTVTPPTPDKDSTETNPAGQSSFEDPFTVAEARENQSGKGYVKGYIVGYYSFNSDPQWIAGSDTCTENANILIADETGELVFDGYLPVQLPIGEVRTALNLADNKTNLGKEVILYGNLTAYCGLPGLKEVEYAYLGGNDIGHKPGTTIETVGNGTFEKPYTTADIAKLNSSKPGPYYVKGYIVGQIAGMKLSSGAEFDSPWSTAEGKDYNTNLLIAASADVDDVNECTPVALVGELRTKLNLPQNPSVHGQEIIIYGSLVPYFGAAGIKEGSYALVGDEEIGVKPSDNSDAIFVETFKSSLGEFTTVDITKPDNINAIWEYASTFKCAKATAHKDGKQAGEGWLVSPAIDLTGETTATLTFQNAGDFFENPAQELQLWASTTSNDPTNTTEWTQLTIDKYSTGKYAWVLSTININDYLGKDNVRFAFKYYSTTTMCGTWEIKEFVIK